MASSLGQAAAGATGLRAADLFALLKPRILVLVTFTGWAGLVAAPGDLHPLLATVAILALALGAGGAGALNQWYERDLDARMRRTMNRPLPAGRVAPEDALAFGIGVSLAAVTLMGLATNWLAAGLLLLANLYYVLIYTVWLKRRTAQNVVLGGAAGAFPPVIGWAAVTGSVDPVPLALFLTVFLWTPPHSWALALFRREDYARADIPMLPVVRGDVETRRQIWLYTLLLVPASFGPTLLGGTGWLYPAVAAAFGVGFLVHAWRLYRSPVNDPAPALFGFSLVYLAALFAAFAADALLLGAGRV